ncbi:MAG TPA: PIG-L family deacetylase [Tepidisphaeraceae bacterium]|jgi:LmbE family N-acetylglucosaminyl deacetylase|nr:PIG-L family deacetylase [Tepidisphaeraceae bacterium]
MRKVAITMLAHPDDAEILCAGTLLRLGDLGWEIHIATATPGDCGTMSESRWKISGIRTAEAEASAKLIGGTYHCLDERDGFVCYDKPTIRKVTDLFRRVAPSLVITHPQKDYMMDHEMISLVTRMASFLYGAPNGSDLPLLPGSAIPHLYYTDPVGGVDPLGKPVTPTTLIDITAKLDKKTEMLACHASQREWLRAHHHMDEYIESMKRHAAERGRLLGVPAAEGFIQHRGHAYPEEDLLKTLLG